MVTKEERKANYQRYSEGLEACRAAYLLGAGWVKVENPRDSKCCWKDPVHGDNYYQGFAVTTQARRDGES
jgi:hypothetical protein